MAAADAGLDNTVQSAWCAETALAMTLPGLFSCWEAEHGEPHRRWRGGELVGPARREQTQLQGTTDPTMNSVLPPSRTNKPTDPQRPPDLRCSEHTHTHTTKHLLFRNHLFILRCSYDAESHRASHTRRTRKCPTQEIPTGRDDMRSHFITCYHLGPRSNMCIK